MSIIVSYGTVLMAVTGDGTADELSQGGSAVLFNSSDTDDTTKKALPGIICQRMRQIKPTSAFFLFDWKKKNEKLRI